MSFIFSLWVSKKAWVSGVGARSSEEQPGLNGCTNPSRLSSPLLPSALPPELSLYPASPPQKKIIWLCKLVCETMATTYNPVILVIPPPPWPSRYWGWSLTKGPNLNPKARANSKQGLNQFKQQTNDHKPTTLNVLTSKSNRNTSFLRLLFLFFLNRSQVN